MNAHFKEPPTRYQASWIFTRAWLLSNDRQDVRERWPVSYRLDTMQIWEEDEERRKLGLHIQLVDDPDWRWAICLGSYVLEYHKYLHRAVAELCTRAGNTVAWAQWHLAGAGYPCHADCDC